MLSASAYGVETKKLVELKNRSYKRFWDMEIELYRYRWRVC